MNAKQFQQNFLDQLHDQLQITSLFDFLPEAYFFAKDEAGRFICVNRALLEALGVEHESLMIGKTDYDFFNTELADSYTDDDKLVMANAKSRRNHVDLVPHNDGSLRWYVVTKIPLLNHDQKAIGIAGVMRDFQSAGAVLEPYQQMSEVIQHVMDHFSQPIQIQELASLAHLSVSQFDRKFKALFKITPLKYITQVRINAAAQLLIRTEDSVTAIAQNAGFYDHSHFTKQFKKHKNMTPTQYRQRYANLD